jgi:hypothetical protein
MLEGKFLEKVATWKTGRRLADNIKIDIEEGCIDNFWG